MLKFGVICTVPVDQSPLDAPFLVTSRVNAGCTRSIWTLVLATLDVRPMKSAAWAETVCVPVSAKVIGSVTLLWNTGGCALASLV